MHDVAAAVFTTEDFRRDLTDEDIAPPSQDARAVLEACFDGDLPALKKAAKSAASARSRLEVRVSSGSERTHSVPLRRFVRQARRAPSVRRGLARASF